ncbi:MAG TPA: hypothetical protein VMB21_08570, partial [Candidatus Limnocylindria bacterium]|nr:hypothetical protein [Candidatus Limnocylindria bacterium]
AALAWWQGWFASEPVYHGRTVTQWLDSMAIYDELRNRDETGQSTFNTERKPEAIPADPALRALLALGPRAVPALRIHLTAPPSPRPWLQRIQHWGEEVWAKLRGVPSPVYFTLPRQYSSRDEARIRSAGLALLAMGTNRGGGMPAMIEEFVRDKASTNRASPEFPAQWAIDDALTGFPELRAEIRDALDGSLTNTNLRQRQFAVRNALARRFPEDFPRWHPLLISMVASEAEDERVRDGAMFALLVRPHSADPEFVALCAQVLTNRDNARLLRARATGGLRFGGWTNPGFLSLVTAATNDADSYIQQSARSALREPGRPGK